jgi:DNA/RNA-binding domain of Phe-tRNA-synthetase-like protein
MRVEGSSMSDENNILVVDDKAKALGVRVAIMISHKKKDVLNEDVLEGEVARLIVELKERYTLDILREDPIVRAYRKFYWRIGIDPTKTRPSSEALVRRALRGKWPRINPIVDAGNIASARFMVPIGLYDLDKAKPPLKLTLSKGGEKFEPIGGKREVLPPGIPILVDSDGTVMHLYPHRDSRKTMITDSTRTILSVAAGVPGVETSYLVETLKELARLFKMLGIDSTDPVPV